MRSLSSQSMSWRLLFLLLSSPGVQGGIQDITWVKIHGGSFMMGDDRLSLSRPAIRRHVTSFKIAKSAVTNDQYAKCVKAGACTSPTEAGRLPVSFRYEEASPNVWHLLPCMCRDQSLAGWCPSERHIERYATWQRQGRGAHPVVCVTYAQAAAFAAWVGGRLPTEQEWEYAAQWRPRQLALARSAATWPPYDGYPDGSQAALGRKNASLPRAVCSFPPTAAGLCDMVGNVFEWQTDTLLPYGVSGVARGLPDEHVVRGGAWTNEPGSVSMRTRGAAWGRAAYYWLGFRPVADLNVSTALRNSVVPPPPLPPPPPPPPPSLFPLLRKDRHERLLFAPYKRTQKAKLYRIPALLATARGVLLLVAEGRVNDHDYNEGSLSLVRSVDAGNTWEPERLLIERRHTCANTPALLLDGVRGRIHLFFSMGKPSSALYDQSVLHVMHSDDDGHSWSSPRNLALVGKPGPGHGLQLIYGAHAGRLVMPCRQFKLPRGNVSFTTTRAVAGLTSAYSDDGGSTWLIGSFAEGGGEVQTFQRSNGTVGAIVRGAGSAYRHGKVFRWSDDGGVHWTSKSLASPTLLESLTACSLLTIPGGSRTTRTEPAHPPSHILYSCPPLPAKHKADHIARRHLTVRMSTDGGATWPYALLIEEGASAYSDMAVGWRSLRTSGSTVAPSDVTIHIAYERGVHRFDEEIVYTRFTLADVYAARVEPATAFDFGVRLPRDLRARRRVGRRRGRDAGEGGLRTGSSRGGAHAGRVADGLVDVLRAGGRAAAARAGTRAGPETEFERQFY